MPSRNRRCLGRPGAHSRFAGAAAAGAIALAVVLSTSACSSPRSVESADVPEWVATALPSANGVVLEDAGKILNPDPIVKTAPGVRAGKYTLTVSCDGGGKAFFQVSLDGNQLTEAGAACNGSRETADITLPASGTVTISTASVDAPLLYGYHLAPA